MKRRGATQRGRTVKVCAAVLALAATSVGLSVGCGGGTGIGLAVASVGGTAAFGAPIGGATVMLKDAAGHTATTTTDATGHYEMDVTGLTPPFLIQLTTTSLSAPAFTVAVAPGNANIDTFTDLLVDTFYAVTSTTPDSVFTGTPTTSTLPSAVQTEILAGLFETMIEKWLRDNNVDPAAFELITTPFTANGAGYDAVLDASTVSSTTDEVTITDGTATQTSSVTTDTTGNVTVATETVSPAGMSQSVDSTVVPQTSGSQTATQGIEAALQSFQDLVNARGSLLADTDIETLLDPGYLNDGDARAEQADSFASFLRGLTMQATLERLTGFDDVNAPQVVDAEIRFTLSTPGAGSERETLVMKFKKNPSNGQFFLFGNRRVAEIGVQLEKRTDAFASGTTIKTAVNVDVAAPVGTVTSTPRPVIDGGPFQNLALQAPTQRSETITPKPGQPSVTVTEDAFFETSGSLVGSAIPSPTTTYTVTLTPTGGSPTVIVVGSNALAGEAITFTVNVPGAATNTHALTDILGKTVTVSWSLPTTYALATIDLAGQVFDAPPPAGNQAFIDADQPFFPVTVTSGTITFPQTMPGGSVPIAEASFNLAFNGVNGERSLVIFQFN